MKPASYLRKALDGEIDRMSHPSGSRAMQAFRGGCALGRLAHEGLDLQEAGRLLIEAAIGTGLSSREARSHVERGLRIGASNPKATAGVVSFSARIKPVPKYPPLTEIADVWEGSNPVTYSPSACKYLVGRGLNPFDIELFDLARVLTSPLPNWTYRGSVCWSGQNYRLAVRLFDSRGAFRSIRVRGLTPDSDPKELSPTGFSSAGLVLADLVAQSVLRGEIPPEWQPRVVICEGVPDWLTWAARYSDADEQAPAVFGVLAGAWTPEIAGRIPSGASVIIRTHGDDQGEKYAQAVIDTLGPRCKLFAPKRGDE